jgi:hypothetical protein
MDPMDIPINALRIAENVDLSVPGRLGLLVEDAMLGTDRWDEVHANHDDGYDAPTNGYLDEPSFPGPLIGYPTVTGSIPNNFAVDQRGWKWHMKLVDPGAVDNLGTGVSHTTYPRRYGLLRLGQRTLWTVNRFYDGEQYRDCIYLRDINSDDEPPAYYWHADKGSPSDPAWGFLHLNENPIEAHDKLIFQAGGGTPDEANHSSYFSRGNQLILWEVPEHTHHNRMNIDLNAGGVINFDPWVNGELVPIDPEDPQDPWQSQYHLMPKYQGMGGDNDDFRRWSPYFPGLAAGWSDLLGQDAKNEAGTSLGLPGKPELDPDFDANEYTWFPIAVSRNSFFYDHGLKWSVANGQWEGGLADLFALAESLNSNVIVNPYFIVHPIDSEGNINYDVKAVATNDKARLLGLDETETIRFLDVDDPFDDDNCDTYIFKMEWIEGNAWVNRPAAYHLYTAAQLLASGSDVVYNHAIFNSLATTPSGHYYGLIKFSIEGTAIEFTIHQGDLADRNKRINWLECAPQGVSPIQSQLTFSGFDNVRNALWYPVDASGGLNSEIAEMLGLLQDHANGVLRTIKESEILSVGNVVPTVGKLEDGTFEGSTYAPVIHSIMVRENTVEGEDLPPSSAFLRNTLWQTSGIAEYYIVAEWDWGGFSSANLVRTATVDTVENGINSAILFLVFELLRNAYYCPEVKRWHIFRKFNPLAGSSFKTETWLFAIDPRDGTYMTSWDGDQDDGSDHALGIYFQQAGREGYIVQNEGEDSLDMLGEPFWSIMRPGILTSFVDYGQDPAGETAETITGVTLDQLAELSFTNNLIRPRGMKLRSLAFNRLWYERSGEIDRAYYSEVNRYNIITKSNFVDYPAAGRFIGATTFHQYLMLFFRNSTMVIDARGGIDLTWQKVFEFTGAGCQTIDTVAKSEQGVFWAGGGVAWHWNGVAPKPSRISEAIEYDGFAEDMYVGDDPEAGYPKSWGYYDPKLNEYMLYIPYMPGVTTIEWGEVLFNSLEDIWPPPGTVGEWPTMMGMKPRLLIWSMKTQSWKTESLRTFINFGHYESTWNPNSKPGFYVAQQEGADENAMGRYKKDCHYWRVGIDYFSNVPGWDEPYRYCASLSRALKPFLLDNYTCIPVGSARSGASSAGGTHNHWLCPYILIRQGVMDFIPGSFWPSEYNRWAEYLGMDWFPMFKHLIVETGQFDAQSPGVEKRSRKLTLQYGGNKVGRETTDGNEEVDDVGPWVAELYGFRTGDKLPVPYRQVDSYFNYWDAIASIPGFWDGDQYDARIIRFVTNRRYGSDIELRDPSPTVQVPHFFELPAPSDPVRTFMLRLEGGQTMGIKDTFGVKVTIPFAGHRAGAIPYRDLEKFGVSFMRREQK